MSAPFAPAPIAPAKPRVRHLAGSWSPIPQAQDTAHAAASRTDSALEHWYPPAGSADTDLLPDLELLRARGRDLTRNNGYAAGADQTFCDNVIGHQLRLQAQPDHTLLGWDRAKAKAWAKNTEHEFQTWWAAPEEIDAAATLDGLGLSILAISAWFQSGEAIAIPHWKPRTGTRWNTRVQIIEADRIETPPRFASNPNIRDGKLIDEFGAPVGFFVRATHPGHTLNLGFGAFASDDYRYIPAYTRWGRRRVIHLYDVRRPEQSRGKSILASVMREFSMGSQYPRVELESTIRSSLISAFLSSDLSQEAAERLFADSNTYDDASAAWVANLKNTPRIQGGKIIPLPLGARIEGFNPGRPNQAFEPFMTSVLRNIAAGLNMPYELIAKDFSKTNYSSARSALLEAWRYFNGRRAWLARAWLTPLYELWLEEAINASRVEAPDYYQNRYAYRRCVWQMSGRGWVDPKNEAVAATTRLGANLTTLQQECLEQGLDYETVLEQRAEEMQLMRELNLETKSVATPPIAGQTPDRDDDNPESSDDDRQAA